MLSVRRCRVTTHLPTCCAPRTSAGCRSTAAEVPSSRRAGSGRKRWWCGVGLRAFLRTPETLAGLLFPGVSHLKDNARRADLPPLLHIVAAGLRPLNSLSSRAFFCKRCVCVCCPPCIWAGHSLQGGMVALSELPRALEGLREEHLVSAGGQPMVPPAWVSAVVAEPPKVAVGS